MNDSQTLLNILDTLGVRDKFMSYGDVHTNTKLIDNTLVWLDLGCLGISSLPPHIFDALPHLEYLGLYGNELTSLNVNIFAQLRQLKYLDLGDNHFTELPVGIFDSLLQLEKVWLYENQLTNVDQLFTQNTKLIELNLNSNNLSHLPAISHLQALQKLELALNPALTDISPEYYQAFPKLESLVFDAVIDDNKAIVNLLKIHETNHTLQPTMENHYVLVTGLMGSGKSTLLQFFPRAKVLPSSPPVQEDIYFDKIVATLDDMGHTVNFFELDGPTILTWKKFIELSDIIIHVINPDILTNPDRALHLIRHIEVYRKPQNTQMLVINKCTNSLHITKIIESINAEFPTVPIYKLSPGTELPTIGGMKITQLNLAEVEIIINAAIDFIVG